MTNVASHRESYPKRLKLIVILFLHIVLIFVYSNASAAQLPDEPGIGIDEKLGRYLPADLEFFDEKGNQLGLTEFIDRPTIVLPVYYSCANVCTVLLSSLAEVLDELQAIPGKDYKVLSISFDERDTPKIAEQTKKNYMASFKKAFPEQSWKFLTGNSSSINAFTDAIGFRFKKRANHFIHPAALIVLSSDRKIVRYLYGETYLPFDLKMAIIEASEGRVGPTITKVLKYCFSYDPEGRRYVFNILRITAAFILFFAIIFVIFLIVTGSRHGKKVI